MKYSIAKPLLIVATVITSSIGVTNHPFPQELDYAGCIKPNDVVQTSMNNSVTDLFDYYKSEYLTPARNTSGGYYTDATGNGGGGKSAVTISEAHGYGMIIYALMAGYDSDAQTIFDGYFKFYQDHPSKINPLCMSWTVDSDESDKAQDGAADGDMDIAYALLLAHYQWGSDGSIDYLNEAKVIINDGIKESDMHIASKRVALGDWTQEGGSIYSTRSSDWMPDHMRAYGAATGDNFWGGAASMVYSLISDLTASDAPSTGLMPDFIKNATPAPDRKAGGTGEKNGADYSYNACRYPWRIATDFAHYGTVEADNALEKISSWLRTSTNGDPDNIYAGYKLTGTKMVNYNELVFTAPFTAGLITDEDNQEFLNRCWDTIKDDRGDKAYASALNLLSMLLISGNWWAPVPQEYTEPSGIELSNEQVSEGVAAQMLIATISTTNGIAPYTYDIISGESDFEIRNDSLFTSRTFSSDDDNFLPCKIRTTDGKGNVKNQMFSIEITDASLNLVQHLWWWTDHDSYGTSIDTGDILINDTSIAVTFNTDKSSSAKDEWVYGILSCDSLTKSLDGARFISIEYRSTNAFLLNLQMGTVLDDAFHSAALPITNGEWQTVTFKIDAETFAQPSDWGEPVLFEPSLVQQFAFNSNFEEESGLLEIRTLQIDGFAVNDIPVALVETSNLARSDFAIKGIQNNNISLWVPTSGNYGISLFNLQGRLVYQSQQEFVAGVTSIPLDANLSTGALILRIENNGVMFTSVISLF